jgi:hypothetical protein
VDRKAHAEKVRMLAKVLAAQYGGGAIAFALEQADQSDGGNRKTWLMVVDALNLDLAADQRVAELTAEAPLPRER